MPASELIEKVKVLNQIDPAKKEYWECWSLKTHRGRQIWEFKMPSFLQNMIEKEEDWNKPEASEFLKKMQQAFVYNKQIQPHSADLVYRTSRLKQTSFQPLKENEDLNTLAEKADHASKKGFHFYQGIKAEDGNWPGD